MSARRLHRWLGLLLGAWFVVLGLTGSVLVYWHALEAAQLPTPAEGAALPLQALFEVAAKHMRDLPWRIFPPDAHHAHARVFFLTDQGRRIVHLDPSTGAVQVVLAWRGAVVHWFYDLHANALSGRTGKLLVGLSAFPLLAMVALGLRLWLKRGAVPLRETILPTGGLRGRRLLSHAHRVTGFWALLPLLLATITGLALSFPETTRLLLEPVTANSPQFRVSAAKGTGPVDLDGAMAVTRSALPGWRLAWAEPPEPDGAPEWLLVLLPEVHSWPSGRAAAYVNAASGRLEEVRLPDGVDHIRAWIMALHNGEAFGLAHRLVVIALGLALVAMAVLGLLLWRRGRRPVAQPLPA